MSDLPRSRFSLPSGWLRAIFGGIEAAVLSWLIAGVGGLAAFAATASAPGLGDATWGTSIAIASGWWMTGFGSSLGIDDGAVTMIPLGLTLITTLLLRGSMRRAQGDDPGRAAFVVIGFVGAVALFSLAVPAHSWVAVLGAFAIAILTGLTVVPLPVDRIPSWVRSAVRTAVVTFMLVLVAGLVTVGIAMALGWDSIRTIHEALQPNTVSSIVLILLQLAYLPNAVLMAVSYLAGLGFAVGEGTQFSPFMSVSEPLPAIPILGALPEPGAGPGWIVLLAPAAIGVLIGVVRSLRRGHRTPQEIGREIPVILLVLYVLTAVSMAIASGSIGPGRMAEIGPSMQLTGLTVTGLVGGGIALGLWTRLGMNAAGFLESETPTAPSAADDDWEPWTITKLDPIPTGGSPISPPSAETVDVSPQSPAQSAE